jgi:hypothetical protein
MTLLFQGGACVHVGSALRLRVIEDTRDLENSHHDEKGRDNFQELAGLLLPSDDLFWILPASATKTDACEDEGVEAKENCEVPGIVEELV